MELGAMGAVFHGLTVDDTIARCGELGLKAIELCCGHWPGIQWGNLHEMADKRDELLALRDRFKKAGVSIRGIASHGNPLHPNPTIRERSRTLHRAAIKIASVFDTCVIAFSGLPGGGPEDKVPNCIVAPWPDEMRDANEWQWNEVAIPYWKEENAFADSLGVPIGFEGHPNQLCWRPVEILRMRNACGKRIGANLDFSHWLPLGINPLSAIAALRECIFHVHAKDVMLNEEWMAVNGPLGPEPFKPELGRAWAFAAIGLAHSAAFWGPIIRRLRQVGYDGVVSIEHEDGLADGFESLGIAINTLVKILLTLPAGPMKWARDDSAPAATPR